jgi:membrane dipeptidase
MNKIDIKKAKTSALKLIGANVEESERGLKLHSESLVCDSFSLYNTFETEEQKAAFFCNMRKAGVTAFATPVGAGKNINECIRSISYMQRYVDLMSPRFSKALCAEDLRKAKEENRFAVIFEFNSPPVLGQFEYPEDELEWLEVFWRLGVRVMHLTYNRMNLIGSGCTEKKDKGLSDFGAQVVAEMNKIGIVVDVPHCSRQTVLDACEIALKPVLASHTMCRRLHDHPRGKTDEEIKAIAKTGGVVGMLSYSSFLSAKVGNINDMLDNIDHAVNLVGVDHVAIGTDSRYYGLDGKGVKNKSNNAWWGNWIPEHRVNDQECFKETMSGSLAWTNWPCFTIGLVKRGYSDSDIKKIIGENYIRVFKDCCG